MLRDNVVIYTGELSSLKRFKDDAKEVAKGLNQDIAAEAELGGNNTDLDPARQQLVRERLDLRHPRSQRLAGGPGAAGSARVRRGCAVPGTAAPLRRSLSAAQRGGNAASQ